jgi:hypothetical protein
VKFAEYAKMYVALVGLVAAGGLGMTDLPASWKLPLEIVAVVATAFATWRVPNTPPDPPAPAWRSAGPAWDEPTDSGDAA